MRIDLPFPDKILWPNGPRPRNHGHRATVAKKHHDWAYLAALEAMRSHCPDLSARPLPVVIEVHAKPKGPKPDPDNCVAAGKHLLDGIAHAIGVNDREFGAPQVVFSPVRDGRFVIEIPGQLPVDNLSRPCPRSTCVLQERRAETRVQPRPALTDTNAGGSHG